MHHSSVDIVSNGTNGRASQAPIFSIVSRTALSKSTWARLGAARWTGLETHLQLSVATQNSEEGPASSRPGLMLARALFMEAAGMRQTTYSASHDERAVWASPGSE